MYECLLGLARWRQGQDPTPDFAAGLDASEQAIAGLSDCPSTPRDVDYLKLYFSRAIAFLMDRELPRLEGSPENFSDFPAIAAGELLNDALYDLPWRDRLPDMMARLGARKRQMIALLSYQVYFDLLDAKGDATRVAELVTQGEALYLRRAKDVFYDDQIFGGGLDNPYTVDWQLAAVLKKIGYQGDSLHQWRWG